MQFPNTDSGKDHPIENGTMSSLSIADGISTVNAISRPFIRASLPQEKISLADGLSLRPIESTTQPRYYVDSADRAGKAMVRMDSRTPGSEVKYDTRSNNTSTDNSGNSNADWSTSTTATTYNYATSDPGQPDLPDNSTGTPLGRNLLNYPLVISYSGDSSNNGIFQGYRLRIRAVGMIGSAFGTVSTEEVLYRSVLTFKVSNSSTSEIAFSAGDQVWVRGGDTLYGSTIPGFPLDSSDNFITLRNTGKRAGVRLLTRIDGSTNYTTSSSTSVWQWVTWDIKAIAYLSLFLGRDDNSTDKLAFQYGPIRLYPQTGNWSGAKVNYGLVPGGHRWLNSSAPDFCNYQGSRTPPFAWAPAFDQRPANGSGAGNTLNYTIPTNQDPYQ